MWDLIRVSSDFKILINSESDYFRLGILLNSIFNQSITGIENYLARENTFLK